MVNILLLLFDRQCARSLLQTILCPVVFVGIAGAGEVGNEPVKLAIKAKMCSISVGEKADIEVSLLNAIGEAVKAEKDVEVEVVAELPKGKLQKLDVIIKAGEGSKTLKLPLIESGIIEVWAKQPELMDDSTFINVKSQPEGKKGPVFYDASWTPTGVTAAARSLTSTATYRPLLALRGTTGTTLADGIDEAEIEVFLMNEDEISRDEDIRINLHNDAGTLSPNSLVIPKGENKATATLVSDKVGIVTVEYMGSVPPADLDGNRILEFRFVPPIVALDLHAAQPISLFEKCQLRVILLDAEKKPECTDELRKVSFLVSSGRGNIYPLTVDIKPRYYAGYTAFIPAWPGDVVVSASINDLTQRTTEIKVTFSWPLLVLTIAGSLMGGAIAYWQKKDVKFQRIIIGLFSGVALYWICAFLGILEHVPAAVVLNPMGVFVVSMFGGWAGPSVVFALILPRSGPQA